MKARDVMTTHVLSVQADASAVSAAQLMLQSKISGLPVVNAQQQLVGIVTEGDFLRRGEVGTERHRPRWLEFLIGPGRLAAEYVRSSGRKVEDIMTPSPQTVGPEAALADVVELMERHRIKRVPVVEDGRLVGIVSRADLMHALVSLARDQKETPSDDVKIRERIMAELDSKPWAPAISVTVRGGVVELWGTLVDERQRQAALVVAQGVPGVKLVNDHMVWIEPVSGMIFQSPEEESRTQAS